VFDSDGTGGDSVAKILNYDSGGNTVGAVSPSDYKWEWLPARSSNFRGDVSFNPNQLNNVNNLFVNDVSNNNKSSPKAGGGYRGELLIFTGFDPNEACGFSGDMDPNRCVTFLSFCRLGCTPMLTFNTLTRFISLFS